MTYAFTLILNVDPDAWMNQGINKIYEIMPSALAGVFMGQPYVDIIIESTSLEEAIKHTINKLAPIAKVIKIEIEPDLLEAESI